MKEGQIEQGERKINTVKVIVNYTYNGQPYLVEVSGTSKRDALVWFVKYYEFESIESYKIISHE